MPEQCNCGLLAQVLFDLKGAESSKRSLSSLGGSWTCVARQMECNQTGLRCNQTGLAIIRVFKSLMEVGLELSDFHEIEYMGGCGRHKEPDYVADQFDIMADKLEQQRKDNETNKASHLRAKRVSRKAAKSKVPLQLVRFEHVQLWGAGSNTAGSTRLLGPAIEGAGAVPAVGALASSS